MDTTKKRISHVGSEAAARARLKLQKKAKAALDSDEEFELQTSTQRRLAAPKGTAKPPSRPLVRGI